jgi:3-oxoacyl-[acyl-carrier protein] reductase
MRELDGKVAIVTGAGRERGIGLASGLEMARRGAAVVLTDLARPAPELEMFGHSTVAEDMAVLERAVDEIQGMGGDSFAMAVDVRSEEEIRACVERTAETFGTVDILFNNAGTGIGAQPFFDLDDNVWEQSWGINVLGMVSFCRAVIPLMQDAGGGSIINNSSIAGLRVWPDFAAYSATKFAVIGLTKALALDFGGEGIRVNAVCPGEIDTQMGDLATELALEAGLITADQAGEPTPAIALDRSGLGDDVAEVVAWLAGPGSRYVTGAAIPVDGAWPEGL